MSQVASGQDIKLYYSPGACSLGPHIVLNELQIPHELKLVSVRDKQNLTPQYLALNPKGRVPLLKVGEELLTEAPAIMQYLAAIDPARRLLPSDSMLLAKAQEWLNWISTSVHAVAYAQLWRAERFVDSEGAERHVRARGHLNVVEAYGYIDQLLQGRTWAVGSHYTLVDAFLLVFYRWGILIGLDMRAAYPNWHAQSRHVLQRDAVVRTLSVEGLAID